MDSMIKSANVAVSSYCLTVVTEYLSSFSSTRNVTVKVKAA